MRINNTSFKQIIKEETETVVFLHMLQERTDYLKSQGFSRQQIRKSIVNEDIMDMLASGASSLWDMAPESIKQSVIEKALEYIEESFGLNPKGWLLAVVNKAVANMNADDWKAVFGGDCKVITKVLTEALEEDLLARLLEKLAGNLFDLISSLVGVEPDGLDDFVGTSLQTVLRNELFEWIKKQEIVAKMTNKVSEKICEFVDNIDLSDVLKGVV